MSSRAKPSIFLAHWYSALCGIAENGKPLAKGARNDGVQERFLATLEMTVWCISSYVRWQKRRKHLRKEQGTTGCKKDFSLCPSWRRGGMGLFHVAYNGYVWKALFPYRHPERSPRSFLHTGIASYVWQSKIWSLPRMGKGDRASGARVLS